jgi:hypothetical protein
MCNEFYLLPKVKIRANPIQVHQGNKIDDIVIDCICIYQTL